MAGSGRYHKLHLRQSFPLLALMLFTSWSSLWAQTTYFSRSPGGNWNSAATWSTDTYDDPDNAGTFPVAGDFVFIGGTGSIVTITGTAAACATVDIADNSTLNVGQGFAVSGTTTIGSGSSGVLSITSTAGGKTFGGLVTINSGGAWSETVVEPMNFQGGISNNGGTFTANTGIHTFTAAQTVSGILTIPNFRVQGGGVFTVTNNGTLHVTDLTGLDGLTQGSGAILNISGLSTITTLNATASNNTVNFEGGAQSVYNTNYFNLTLSGSGVKTLQTGTTAIGGDLTLSGTASATAVTGLTIGDAVDIGAGTTLTAGAFTHSVGGDWINNGAFNGTGSVINLNGGAQNISGVTTTFDDLLLSGSGTKTFSVSTTISDELSIASGAQAALDNANTYTSNTLILGGALQGSGTWGSSSSGAGNPNDFFFSGTGFITVNTGGFTYYSRLNDDWAFASTWSTIGFGGAAASSAPGAGDYVIIGDGKNVTVTGNEVCENLLFDAAAGATSTLTMVSGSLAVAQAITLPESTSGSNVISMAGGTLTAPGLDFIAGGGAGHELTIAGGTVTISGNITGIDAGSTVNFTIAGTGTLQVGGSMFTPANGTLTAQSGTVEYNGAAQTIEVFNYNNLTLSGSGNKTPAGTMTINGDLNVGTGTTFNVSGVTLDVTGSSTIDGTFTITTNPGTKTFNGPVTVNGTWTNTTEAITFSGGLTNNGSFTAGTGTHTFNAAQTIDGILNIPTVNVAGPGAFAVTNDGTLTVTTSLQGADQLAQGSGAILNISGLSTITTLNAVASGNTVEFSGSAQTINNNNYFNLILSGSGIKTLQTGTTSIGGNLELKNTVSVTAVTGLTIGATLDIDAGTTFTAGTFTHTLGGNLTNDGTFNGAGSNLALNGAAQSITGGAISIADLQLNGSGIKTIGTSITMSGDLSINNGVEADLDNSNVYQSNTLSLGGLIQIPGTWGSPLSAAINQNDTFFNGTGLVTVNSGGFNYYSIASDDWSLNTTWSTTGFGGLPAAGFPGAGDFVFIGGGNTVDVSGSEACATLTFDAGSNVTNTLAITGSLAVSGEVTIPQTVTSGSNILSVGAGSMTAGSIDFTATGSGAGHQMTLTTGTATISGDITGIGASSNITFTGAGLLRVGGAMFSSTNGTLSTVAGSTVEYNGSSQTVEALPYNNLTLSGTGDKTLAATTTVAGSLNVNFGSNFIVGGVSLTVNGATTVASGGTLTINANPGTKRFDGLVTVNGTWTNTTEGVTFRGGITKGGSGTFTAGTGNHTFNTNSQTLNGTFVIPTVTVTGVVLENANSLTVSTLLDGSGILTQRANAVLNIGGNSTIAIMIASASGNTVNYTGTNQTVNSNDFFNLTLSNSGLKTLQPGTTSIAGDFTLSGTASTTTVAGLTIAGNLNVGNGTNLTVGSVSFTVNGTTTIDGTLSLAPNPGIKTFRGLVTVATSGTWFNQLSDVTFQGGITLIGSAVFTAGTGNYTFDTNVQALTGTFFIPNVIVNGGAMVLVNTNSLTISTSLSGSGNLSQASNALLNIGGSSTITLLTATASGNTVNYTGANQDVYPTNYHHLTLSGSGIVDLQTGTTTIGGDFTLSGMVTTEAVTGLTINGSIDIGSNATFTAAAFTHIVEGDWINNGTFDGAGSTIRFDGPTDQDIEGSSPSIFNNLEVTNDIGIVTFNSAQSLTGLLSLGPDSYVNANGFLTLLSSSDTQSASIGEIVSGATLEGDIIVQRFMGAEGSFNRYVSSPVTGATLSELANTFALVRDLGQTYNEPLIGSYNDGYVNVSLGTTLESGKGYLVVPTPAFANSDITWDLTGPLTDGFNQGDVDLNVTYTDHGDVNADGWNLVGNPYPSAIVWDGNLANWDIQDMEPTVFVPDIANPAYFMSYDYSTGLGVPGVGTLAGGVIALGQAFWVKAQGPALSPTLLVRESAKTNSSGEFYRKAPLQNNGLAITLDDQIGKDMSWLMVKPDALTGYDELYDRSKLEAPAMSVSFIAGNRKLVNSTIPEIGNVDIPLYVRVSRAGEFTISFEQIGNLQEYEELFLMDAESGNAHKISAGPYAFLVRGEKEMTGRFYLSKRAEGGDALVSTYPNPVMDQLTVTVFSADPVAAVIKDMTGKTVAEGSLDRSGFDTYSATFDLGYLPRGIYLVNTRFGDKSVTKKIVKY